jgi:hypothetical protein
MTSSEWALHLSNLAQKINPTHIVWAAGASSVLYEHGLTETIGDLDLMVRLEDAETLDRLLDEFAVAEPEKDHPKYRTAFFREYRIDGVEVDVMAGFAIVHDAGVYTYQFDHNAVDRVAILNGVGVPIAALEDWYVLYQLMEGREAKVQRIEMHFAANGIEAPIRLEAALRQPLPAAVRRRILALLENPEISLPSV